MLVAGIFNDSIFLKPLLFACVCCCCCILMANFSIDIGDGGDWSTRFCFGVGATSAIGGWIVRCGVVRCGSTGVDVVESSVRYVVIFGIFVPSIRSFIETRIGSRSMPDIHSSGDKAGYGPGVSG